MGLSLGNTGQRFRKTSQGVGLRIRAKNGEGVEGLPQISVQWPAESSSILDSQNPAGGRTEGKEKVLEEGPLNDRA